jgi:hypothetical protein
MSIKNLLLIMKYEKNMVIARSEATKQSSHIINRLFIDIAMGFLKVPLVKGGFRGIINVSLSNANR